MAKGSRVPKTRGEIAGETGKEATKGVSKAVNTYIEQKGAQQRAEIEKQMNTSIAKMEADRDRAIAVIERKMNESITRMETDLGKYEADVNKAISNIERMRAVEVANINRMMETTIAQTTQRGAVGQVWIDEGSEIGSIVDRPFHRTVTTDTKGNTSSTSTSIMTLCFMIPLACDLRILQLKKQYYYNTQRRHLPNIPDRREIILKEIGILEDIRTTYQDEFAALSRINIKASGELVAPGLNTKGTVQSSQQDLITDPSYYGTLKQTVKDYLESTM